jgi:hypothetical protein
LCLSSLVTQIIGDREAGRTDPLFKSRASLRADKIMSEPLWAQWRELNILEEMQLLLQNFKWKPDRKSQLSTVLVVWSHFTRDGVSSQFVGWAL